MKLGFSHFSRISDFWRLQNTANCSHSISTDLWSFEDYFSFWSNSIPTQNDDSTLNFMKVFIFTSFSCILLRIQNNSSFCTFLAGTNWSDRLCTIQVKICLPQNSNTSKNIFEHLHEGLTKPDINLFWLHEF